LKPALETTDPIRSPRFPWKRPLGALGIVALGLLIAFAVLKIRRSPDDRPKSAASSASQNGPAIALTIDFGDGFQKRFPALAWEPGMTVLDALRAATRHPRGIGLESVGKGAMTLITAIDGVGNQGGGTGTRNWIYRVNGRQATRSCAVFELRPGDRVLWAFTFYD